jgi:hypothetical protein
LISAQECSCQVTDTCTCILRCRCPYLEQCLAPPLIVVKTQVKELGHNGLRGGVVLDAPLRVKQHHVACRWDRQVMGFRTGRQAGELLMRLFCASFLDRKTVAASDMLWGAAQGHGLRIRCSP